MLFFRHLTLLRLTCGLDLRPHMQMTLLILVLKYDFLLLFCFWTLMFRAVERREGMPPFHVSEERFFPHVRHMSVPVVSGLQTPAAFLRLCWHWRAELPSSSRTPLCAPPAESTCRAPMHLKEANAGSSLLRGSRCQNVAAGARKWWPY